MKFRPITSLLRFYVFPLLSGVFETFFRQEVWNTHNERCNRWCLWRERKDTQLSKTVPVGAHVLLSPREQGQSSTHVRFRHLLSVCSTVGHPFLTDYLSKKQNNYNKLNSSVIFKKFGAMSFIFCFSQFGGLSISQMVRYWIKCLAKAPLSRMHNNGDK